MACKYFENEPRLGWPNHCKAGEDMGKKEELDRMLSWAIGCAGDGCYFDVTCEKAWSRARRDRMKIEDKTKT